MLFESFIDVIGKRRTTIIGSLLIGAFSSVSCFFSPDQINVTYVIHEFLISSGVSFLIWEGNNGIYCFFDKRYTWEEQPRQRVFFQFFTCAIFTAAVVLATLYLYSYVSGRALERGMLLSNIITGVMIAIFINAIYISNHFFIRWKSSMVETEQLKSASLRSQFDNLKSQVNPHFLFNSLSTLSAIIPEDQDQAAMLVQKLSSVYRYMLQHKDTDTVTLETELKFIQDFTTLLKARFGDHLQIDVNVSERYRHTEIAPLTLQLLMENAVRFNVISKSKPLQLSIFVEEEKGQIVVKNCLQRKASLETERHHGLQSIINRYKSLSETTVDIFETSAEFMVKLPLLNFHYQMSPA